MNQKGVAPILIVILIALAISGYLLYQNSSKLISQPQNSVITPQISQTISVPSPTPNKNQANFVPGEVTVGIKSGVKVKDAEQFIKSYDLKYKADYKRLDFANNKEVPYDPEDIIGERPFWLIVFVPIGEENKWIKIFESNSIVKYASLDHYSYLQNQ